MTTPLTTFALRFSPTARGARLARRLASHRMDAWGWTYGSDAHDSVELIVAELAANAVTHGLVPGRDAELALVPVPDLGLVRIEVSDARGECLPRSTSGDTGEDSGRGLLLVAALADSWGVTARVGGPGKTVWATSSPGPAPCRRPTAAHRPLHRPRRDICC
ncbi:ATP-binding protein [Streptomyces sp. CRN 30]|uniref:ATP-binding protein n=1 Tax=Streptomyces sp. CRN 30 TaxID=3075613 RepID=UPI002A818DE9|nr:ATP-binding protein [Streptomyces sp. CRN 30]